MCVCTTGSANIWWICFVEATDFLNFSLFLKLRAMNMSWNHRQFHYHWRSHRRLESCRCPVGEPIPWSWQTVKEVQYHFCWWQGMPDYTFIKSSKKDCLLSFSTRPQMGCLHSKCDAGSCWPFWDCSQEGEPWADNHALSSAWLKL